MNLVVSKNQFILVSKVVEGKYPNYKQVIPKDDFNVAEVKESSCKNVLIVRH